MCKYYKKEENDKHVKGDKTSTYYKVLEEKAYYFKCLLVFVICNKDTKMVKTYKRDVQKSEILFKDGIIEVSEEEMLEDIYSTIEEQLNLLRC